MLKVLWCGNQTKAFYILREGEYLHSCLICQGQAPRQKTHHVINRLCCLQANKGKLFGSNQPAHRERSIYQVSKRKKPQNPTTTTPTNQTSLFQEIQLKEMFHLYLLKEHRQSSAADSTVIFSPSIFVVFLILIHQPERMKLFQMEVPADCLI